jgi:hypothetical protein
MSRVQGLDLGVLALRTPERERSAQPQDEIERRVGDGHDHPSLRAAAGRHVESDQHHGGTDQHPLQQGQAEREEGVLEHRYGEQQPDHHVGSQQPRR